MEINSPETDEFVVILIGQFTPLIFQPYWLARNDLIREEEASNAKNVLLTEEVCQFTTDWLTVQVLQNRLTLAISDPTKMYPLRDVTIGIFKILDQTPVSAFGLNRDRDYRLTSEEEWHNFGHFYAPKSPWEGIMVKPGLRVLTMEGKRQENEKNPIQVQFRPSIKVQPNGLRLHVHEHCDLPKSEAAVLLDLLPSTWLEFVRYSDSIPSIIAHNFNNRIA